ncbi:hypothetical protein ARAM_000915 [Aspergillus rambellii]|uniref:Rhodopsin domain-containing protein n=1 Tax=Aspergillus rambellii TaxID=308745 RepID=A0A0F8U089_9EURO|nr:hypothetical protein ARAM_000915 [Aspergillus rambellii]
MTKDDRSLEVKTVAAVFMSVASVAVILRCYVRGWVVKALGGMTRISIGPQIFYAMFSGCMIGGAIHGTGRKFAVLTAHERVTAMRYWWLCEIAYCFASFGCKVSVCIFLLRITVKRAHIWILYTVMLLTVLAGLAFMFVLLLQCRPLAYFWTRTAFDPNIKGSCISMDIIVVMTYIYSAFAALCDFTVGILPIFIVHKLHMRTKTKLAVIGILSMACIASSAVIIRIPYVRTFKDPDFLYATVEIALWSNIETGLGITAGSLATLRPLVRKWLGSAHDPYYDTSRFQGPSGSRRHPDTSRDRPLPLGSIDHDGVHGHGHGRLRPDKLAVTVTTVHTHHDSGDRWTVSGSLNSSEERLTADQQKAPVSSPFAAQMTGGIHRTFELTQTSTNLPPTGVKDRF